MGGTYPHHPQFYARYDVFLRFFCRARPLKPLILALEDREMILGWTRKGGMGRRGMVHILDLSPVSNSAVVFPVDSDMKIHRDLI